MSDATKITEWTEKKAARARILACLSNGDRPSSDDLDFFPESCPDAGVVRGCLGGLLPSGHPCDKCIYGHMGVKPNPEECDGCGCLPGDGATEGCEDPDGCGFIVATAKTMMGKRALALHGIPFHDTPPQAPAEPTIKVSDVMDYLAKSAKRWHVGAENAKDGTYGLCLGRAQGYEEAIRWLLPKAVQ